MIKLKPVKFSTIQNVLVISLASYELAEKLTKTKTFKNAKIKGKMFLDKISAKVMIAKMKVEKNIESVKNNIK